MLVERWPVNDCVLVIGTFSRSKVLRMHSLMLTCCWFCVLNRFAGSPLVQLVTFAQTKWFRIDQTRHSVLSLSSFFWIFACPTRFGEVIFVERSTTIPRLAVASRFFANVPTFRPKEYFSPDRREHDSNLFPTTLTQEKALRTREVKTALKQFTTMEFSVTTVGPAYRYTLYPLPGWASY